MQKTFFNPLKVKFEICLKYWKLVHLQGETLMSYITVQGDRCEYVVGMVRKNCTASIPLLAWCTVS